MVKNRGRRILLAKMFDFRYNARVSNYSIKSMIFALPASVGYLLSVLLLYREKHHYRTAIIIAMSVAFAAHFAQAFSGLQGAMNDVSVMNMLTLVAVCMAAIGAIRYFLRADQLVYTVVASIAAVCVWFPVIFHGPASTVSSWGLKLHIVLSISAYIALGFAALYGCFLWLQDHRLRHGQGTMNFSLPLNDIERTMMSFTIVGEILLSLSLATGLLFIQNIWAQHVSHKVVFGIIAWLIIGILLIRHYRQGFRGRQAAIWLLSGFMFLVLAYFGSAFVLQILLHQ